MSAPWFQDALDGSEDPEALRSRAQAQVERVRARLAERPAPAPTIRYISAQEAIAEWIEEERRSSENDRSTGWASFDALLGKPMRHSEVIICAARTGVGKTWILQGIIENVLEAHLDVSALLVQLEMPAFHQGERLATHALDVAPGGARALARGKLEAEDVIAASPLLSRVGLVTQMLRVDQLGEAIAAAEEATGHRPSILCVDYLGLLRAPGKTRYEQASEVSRTLKEVSKEEGVLLLAAAQLSREAGDGTRRPTLDMIRDSGVAEEAADRVFGMWRPQMIDDEDEPSITDGMELGMCVLKNRFGPSGGETTLVYDYALRLREAQNDGIPW